MSLADNYRRGSHRGPCRSALSLVQELNLFAEERKLSDEEIARRAGVHPITLSQWRRGKRSPTLQNIEAVVEALGGRLTIEWEDEKPAE